LHEAGIRPAFVAGTSVGSLIGAALAAGMGWRELSEMARSVFWPRLTERKLLEQFCVEHLPNTFADLDLPFAAVVTALPDKRAISLTMANCHQRSAPVARCVCCAVRCCVTVYDSRMAAFPACCQPALAESSAQNLS